MSAPARSGRACVGILLASALLASACASPSTKRPSIEPAPATRDDETRSSLRDHRIRRSLRDARIYREVEADDGWPNSYATPPQGRRQR